MPTELTAGTIILGRYRVHRLLGEGSHGRVHLAEDLGRGGQRVALKIVQGLVGATPTDPAEAVLRWIRHPNWAAVLDSGPIVEHDRFQAMRYVAGKSLDQLEGPQSAELGYRLLEDGARVLRALHGHDVIHYDITPGNLIVEDGPNGPTFVLTDGGLAHLGPVKGVARGTPLYMAPELTEDGPHDHRVDLYSLGLVAFRLLTGAEPIDGDAGEVLGRRRREDAPRVSTLVPGVPKALDDLVASLLERDPNARPANAHALLDQIAAARKNGVSLFSPAETAGASSGGKLIGREAEIERFQATVRQVARHVPEQAGAGTRQPCSGIVDPVLLLSGPSGAGATQLARAMSAEAREAELPVMLLAGRDTAPDRRAPLRRLVDGLNALGRQPGERYEPVRLDLRSTAEAADRAHSTGRAVEVLLRVAERAAERTPWVLVVEDFQDLPETAQEAVRVLSRHLLARAEHSGRRSQPAIALAVDLGSAEPDSLIIPDAEEPRKPIVELEPLTGEQLEAICADRYAGLEFLPQDRDAVEKAAGGNPGTVVALLQEAANRNDIHFEAGRWNWDVRDVASYPIRRDLTPEQQRFLEELDPSARSFAEHLAIVDNDLPEDVAEHLLEHVGLDTLPESPLLVVSEHRPGRVVALTPPAVRTVLLDSLSDENRRSLAAAVADCIERTGKHTILHASALASSARPTKALAALASGSYDDGERARALRALRDVLDRHPEAVADTPESLISGLISRGPDGLAVGRIVATDDGPQLSVSASVQVAEVLEYGLDFATARRLLKRALQRDDAGAERLCQLHTARARLALVDGDLKNAEGSLANARRELRTARREGPLAPSTLPYFLLAKARLLFMGGRRELASKNLVAAEKASRRARMPALRALVLNNLGIVHQQLGRLSDARRSLERACRLKDVLGDINGTIRTRMNLGGVFHVSGDPLRSARAYQETASLATRHGVAFAVTRALRSLSSLYDQQQNPRMARTTVDRALRVALGTSDSAGAVLCACDRAQLDAAFGATESSRSSHVLAVRLVRNLNSDDLWNQYLASRLNTALLEGDDGIIPVLARKLDRRRDGVARASLTHSQSLIRVASALDARVNEPHGPAPTRDRNSSSRPLIRVANWAIRVRKQGRVPPLPWSSRSRVGANRAPIDGPARRLLIDAAIRSIDSMPGVEAEALANQLEHHLETTGERVLLARLLAKRSVASREHPADDCARWLSRAVGLLYSDSDASSRLPEEFRTAAASAGLQVNDSLTSTDLHAACHQMLLRASTSRSGDDRLASALRRVLAATTRMNAGGSLSDLLADMTRNAIEITGAERACVVRLEGGDNPEITVANSAADKSQILKTEDLSHTVIQRVIDSHKPLLLHDVFDDEELLGRPSITNLSLRSILCVPMLRGEVLYGVLYADNASAAGSFDNIDLEVLSLFAEQAAAALETNRLVSDLQNSMDELKAMQERLVRGERLRVIGELSSGVAHEFNNLLTSILARVQLLNLNPLSPALRKDLELIEKACLDAAEVVRRLQSFSKSQREADFRPLDVAEICSDAVEFLRPLWTTRRRQGKAPINVRLRAERDVTVQGDPTALREVLTNLLKNGLDVLGNGGEIEIRAVRRADQVRISVIDDGPGIPADILPKVCDPFFTTKGERGTGLGLCLSQQIIEQHGGTFEIHSEEERGTAIHILLPSSAAISQAEALLGHGGLPTAPQRFRVLVVDDDDDVRDPLCAYLERAGFDVVAAPSGIEGIELASRERPDVVISDIGMPGIDGMELCRRLNRELPDLPIILMSGWASGVDPSQARRVGATALLAKPFAMQEVTELLSTVASAVN